MMIDLLFRGGAVGLLLLLAVMLWRAKGAHRLLGLGCAGGASYLLVASPALAPALGFARLPLAAFAATGPLWFLIASRRLFGAPQVLKPAQLFVLGAGLAGLALVTRLAPGAVGASLSAASDVLLLGLFLATLYGAASGLADDLDPQRRSQRLMLLQASAVFGALVAVAALAGTFKLMPAALGEARDTIVAAAAFVLSAAFCMTTLQLGEPETRLSNSRSPDSRSPDPRSKPPGEGAPSALAGKIIAALERDRLYRRPDLSLGALARVLDADEHHVRQAINAELGFRNFSAFVNGFRLQDVHAALSDAGQMETSISTIALDAGFGSIASFNRVFRAAYGVTPTDFRRQAGG
jgi:AraC-like DNA-binding protein